MWEEPLVPNSAVCMEYQGGNFHLKVGGVGWGGGGGGGQKQWQCW